MAQMYRFTDANGEVRLMAEIAPAPGGSLPSQWTVDSAGDVEIAPDEGGSGDAPLVVRGTDDHFEIQAWKNKVGNTVGDIDTSGTLSISGPLSIGGSGDVGDATTFFADGSQNTVHDVIQANAAGDVKAGVNADGALYTQLHAAPSDAHVFAGRLTIWFDNTDGAAKLMVKAKDAGGNIVTGEIPLT